ncbi:glycosyltransferase family 2 protein [Paraburkholderia sp. J10-1]|uniref:glycosyltransferase family 2 protein n=1 Tax=Paraburkholderia sp. J10-1 TaxID=2805430 RepID=UPI002AB77725|nr:glycosyltransferase family 2 protein [Paraburkholderia sp. J10-1]
MTVSAVSSVDHGVVSVSVVVFNPDQQLLAQTFASLAQAGAVLARAETGTSIHLYLVDNGGLPDMRSSLAELSVAGIECTVLAGHGNIGYGRGHNLAIEQASSHYHLVLNPDVDLEAGALVAAMGFLTAHPEAGLLAPAIVDDAGRLQYLCRQYPTLIDLFVRGFLPHAARRLFDARLARYEMRAQINERDTIWDPPIVSGCFMLFRTSVLKKLAGFDARYFLYFEDYDLSLRAHDVARVVYAPSVRVLHHGGGASRKGLAHIRMFLASAFKFYNRFGWKWL